MKITNDNINEIYTNIRASNDTYNIDLIFSALNNIDINLIKGTNLESDIERVKEFKEYFSTSLTGYIVTIDFNGELMQNFGINKFYTIYKSSYFKAKDDSISFYVCNKIRDYDWCDVNKLFENFR